MIELALVRRELVTTQMERGKAVKAAVGPPHPSASAFIVSLRVGGYLLTEISSNDRAYAERLADAINAAAPEIDTTAPPPPAAQREGRGA